MCIRDRNNTGKQHSGSGIGLSLVKSLIELHHGGIIISSKPNAGTEVIIALPISDAYLTKEEKTEEQQEKTKTEEIKENTLEEQQKEITNSKE